MAEHRGDVVEALVEAYSAAVPWAALAALDFSCVPPPTDDERAEARMVMRRRIVTEALEEQAR